MGLKFPGMKSAVAPSKPVPAPKAEDLDIDDAPAPKTEPAPAPKKGAKAAKVEAPVVTFTVPEHFTGGDSAAIFKSEDDTVVGSWSSKFGVFIDRPDAAWSKSSPVAFAGGFPVKGVAGEVVVGFGEKTTVKTPGGKADHAPDKIHPDFNTTTLSNCASMVGADAMTFLRVNVEDLVRLAKTIGVKDGSVVIGFPSTTPDAAELKGAKNNYLRGAVMVAESGIGFFAVDYPPEVANATKDVSGRIDAIRKTIETSLPSAASEPSPVTTKMIDNIKRRCANIAGTRADAVIASVTKQVDEVLAPVTDTAKKGGLKFGKGTSKPIASTQSTAKTDQDQGEQLDLDLDGDGEGTDRADNDGDEQDGSQDSVDIDPGEGEGVEGEPDADIEADDLDLDLDE